LDKSENSFLLSPSLIPYGVKRGFSRFAILTHVRLAAFG
jgi:hypothetical protein